MKKLAILAVLIGLVFLGAELAAKVYVESRFEAAAEANLPSTSKVSVNVSLPFLLPLLTEGLVTRVDATVTNVDFADVAADRVSVELANILLDRGKTLSEGEPVIVSIGRLTMSFEITQEEASKALPDGLSFRFEEDAVILLTPVGEVTGIFEVNGETIRFVAKGSNLPAGISSPSLKLGQNPLVSCFEDSYLAPGRLTVECSIDDPPPRFPPSLREE